MAFTVDITIQCISRSISGEETHIHRTNFRSRALGMPVWGPVPHTIVIHIQDFILIIVSFFGRVSLDHTDRQGDEALLPAIWMRKFHRVGVTPGPESTTPTAGRCATPAPKSETLGSRCPNRCKLIERDSASETPRHGPRHRASLCSNGILPAGRSLIVFQRMSLCLTAAGKNIRKQRPCHVIDNDRLIDSR